MYYPEEVIEEVRTRNDIVDIISGYVKLQKKGSNYFGLCPFHHAKIAFLFCLPVQADVPLLWLWSQRECVYLCDGI